MPTDFAFRFATYLTLLLSCICAGYAEWEYLREVTFFTGIVAVLIAVAFAFDLRGQTVSLLSANIVGGGIILLTALWFGLHYRNPDSPMNSLPWPASALPYLVALLMVLVPAKLIRPKHVGDWWALQGLGLSMVAVGGAMTDDGLYMALMVLYSVAGVWSLTLFYIRRVSGHVPPPPPFEPVFGLRALFSPQTYLPRWFFVARSRPTVAMPFAGLGRPTPTERLGRSHFFRATRWVIVAAVMALPMFFLTPRTEGLRWELFNSRIETGISRSTVDLSRTGELLPNPKPAFTVIVTNPDGSPGVMPEDRRFRVSSHCSYFHQKGIWNRMSLGHLYPVPRDGLSLWPAVNRVPPQNYGPDTVLLEFVLETDLFGSPMADPAYHHPGQPAPVFFYHDNRYHYATSHNNGSFRIPTFDPSERGKIRNYWQYHRSGDHTPGARWRLRDDDATAFKTRLPLLELASKRIAVESKNLLERFFRDGTLSPAIRDRADPATLLPSPEDHITVARAFERHLAASGEYEYTLSLRRYDRTIDPIEDFLFHTKSGHCERFASALTLLLRGVGIPAQFVIGYRGCIPIDDGKYLVRQDHAHAWVEILVADRVPGTIERDWYWYTLDPTAGSRDPADPAAGSGGSRFFSAFITGLTPERQKQLIEDLQDFGTRNLAPVLATVVFGLTLAIVTVLARRRLRRNAQPIAGVNADPLPWFTRLVDLLARVDLVWESGQTPAEFARIAAVRLASNPETETIATIPVRIADFLVRHRYAGQVITEGDRTAIQSDLDRLAAALPAPEISR